MSHYADEPYSVYQELKRTAMKDHVCDACELPIRKGEVYFDIRMVFEGTAEQIKRCIRCQQIHEYLRGLSDDMWPDERLNCGEEFTEHWGKPPPEWLAALAFWQPGERMPAHTACGSWSLYGRPPTVCWHAWHWERRQPLSSCQPTRNSDLLHLEACS